MLGAKAHTRKTSCCCARFSSEVSVLFGMSKRASVHPLCDLYMPRRQRWVCAGSFSLFDNPVAKGSGIGLCSVTPQHAQTRQKEFVLAASEKEAKSEPASRDQADRRLHRKARKATPRSETVKANQSYETSRNTTHNDRAFEGRNETSLFRTTKRNLRGTIGRSSALEGTSFRAPYDKLSMLD